MNRFHLSAIFAAFLFVIACNPKTGGKIAGDPVKPGEPNKWETMTKPVMGADTTAVEGEDTVILDEMGVSASKNKPELPPDTLPHYNASHTFEQDLIHTKIEISFDWAKKYANGKATLTLKPWFYPTDKLTLDAKNFDIKSVSLEGSAGVLQYAYDNEQLIVDLGKTFTRNDQYKVVISYTAKPDERKNLGGSAAITSDKGLYFINADGKDPNKPRQIWTQGETESNSCWFPTVDKPNERCTQEMYITVEDKYKTLSNGLLISSKKNSDGTRTDYWKMDKPHAPYLFMMAIGEYAVVKDKWRGIDVDYYVEPKYESIARDIFPFTPEMLEFFSTKLNYPYPWSKFSQVVVRDYVSGAMENTTSVVFGEFVQTDKRHLLDSHESNESVVAHEMFHQWFGDLVTCESWSNLTLNEGFANYSEYLWMEHKYGRLKADHYLMGQQDGYFNSAKDHAHDLIDFQYDDRESMFDGHSYNKGGSVYHMLRTYLGDDAFFAGLNRYLKKNEYSDVEAPELRMAMEEVSGQDLNWFFNEWFYHTGHPELDITYGWDEATKKATVTVDQQQKAENNTPYIFEMPLAVDIYDASGKAQRQQIWMNRRSQTFTFDAPVKPAFVNFDADKALLCEKTDHHTGEEWAFLFKNGPLFRDRWEAIKAMADEDAAVYKPVYTAALNDPSPAIRRKGLMMINKKTGLIKDVALVATAAKMADTEKEINVRAAAIRVLGDAGDKQYQPIVEKGVGDTEAYSVVESALIALNKLDPTAALIVATRYEPQKVDDLVEAIGAVYVANPDPAHLAFFENNQDNENINPFTLFEQHRSLLTALGDAVKLDEAIAKWNDIALNMEGNMWKRFAATKAMSDVRGYYKKKGDPAKVEAITGMIKNIKAKETDETLKTYYGMF